MSYDDEGFGDCEAGEAEWLEQALLAEPVQRGDEPGYDPFGVARDNAIKALLGIMAEAAKEAPVKGKRVEVIRGKHKGLCGMVIWHGVDRYSHAGRYGSDMSDALRVARGVYGFRVRVQPENGPAVFVAADAVVMR